MSKAIALYSGGLDSTLAILVIMKQGIAVSAVTFLTSIGCGVLNQSSGYEKLLSTAGKFGFKVNPYDLSDKFIGIIKNPKFGYGKNMNPCLDCKILMLREAKEIMRATSADFIITGEVLYQRPMSQRRDTFPKIEKEAGVVGSVVRPLSAKRLRPSLPEESGLVDREKLYDFCGRSRKPQMMLAQELGLTDYPQPAGGCLLTDPVYSFRLRELLLHNPDAPRKELSLLRLGRHFRVSDSCKIVVGRDEMENAALQALTEKTDYVLSIEDYGSPITLIRGSAPNKILQLAAAICARYSDARHLSSVDVTVSKNGETFKMCIAPAPDNVIERTRIQPR